MYAGRILLADMDQDSKIFILTNFNSFLRSYSPIIVVSEQLKMLIANGYQPTLIATEGWEAPEDSIFSKVKTVKIPVVPVSNDGGMDATFDEDVYTLKQALNDILPDEAVVITHDLIFLPDYVKHNVAARAVAQERSSINWIHWIHSATAPGGLIEERKRYTEKYKEMLDERFPNSIVAFPNGYDVPRVARNFSFEEDQIFEVPHPIDVTLGFHPITKRIYKRLELWRPDVFMVYPARLDRGKNLEMNIRYIKGCKDNWMSATLLICDFQSTGDDKVVYREDLKKLAADLGVEDNVHFLSELDPAAQMEVDQVVIRQLLHLSNVFMMPSKSETYSLVTQEALWEGNFLILNHDFPPFRHIYGKHGIYRQFSSNIGIDGQNGEITTSYNDPNAYFLDMARATKYYIDKEKVLGGRTFVRKYRTPEAVFKNHFEPLLHRKVTDDGEV
jgi:glycosyltransferase involved in cell wall biosynthesis